MFDKSVIRQIYLLFLQNKVKRGPVFRIVICAYQGIDQGNGSKTNIRESKGIKSNHREREKHNRLFCCWARATEIGFARQF